MRENFWSEKCDFVLLLNSSSWQLQGVVGIYSGIYTPKNAIMFEIDQNGIYNPLKTLVAVDFSSKFSKQYIIEFRIEVGYTLCKDLFISIRFWDMVGIALKRLENGWFGTPGPPYDHPTSIFEDSDQLSSFLMVVLDPGSYETVTKRLRNVS